ncbi:metallopeptidase [Synechococcus sp. A18-40]|nr:metallopeptidase [Synechococcus sp. A18-40]
MAYKTAIEVPRSGNAWIDGLTDGYRWGTTATDPAVGTTFISDTSDLPGGEFGGYPSWGWSDQERQLMEGAMEEISAVCSLQFVDRGDDNDDAVEIWFYNLDKRQSEGSYGFAYTPGSDSDEGLVAINWSTYQNADGSFKNSIASGSFYGITYLHETSHAVGLKHPHDKGLFGQPRFPGLTRQSDEYLDKGDYDQNAQPFTQLTYVDKGARNGMVPRSIEAYGFLQTLGALDIAALQWMYGINPDAASGDNKYTLPLENREGTGWRAIWDTGGVDRITAAGAIAPVTIDLRNATLGDDVNAGGYVSRAEDVFGGFTIAHDWDGRNLGQPAGLCVIEIAIGGKGDDLLIGNDADNQLKGKKGADVLAAGGGDGNRVSGGKGRDQFWISAQQGALVEVTDFNPRKDRLVFDVDDSAVTLDPVGDGSQVLIDGRVVAQLPGVSVSDLDLERHALFSGFEGL